MFTSETSGRLFIEMSLTEACKAGHNDPEHPTSEGVSSDCSDDGVH